MVRFGPRDSRTRGFFLRRDQFAIDQNLSDLNRVQRRALAQIIGDTPKRETVLDRRVLADAGDIGRVLARRFMRRDRAAWFALIDHQTAGGLPQYFPRLIGADL